MIPFTPVHSAVLMMAKLRASDIDLVQGIMAFFNLYQLRFLNQKGNRGELLDGCSVLTYLVFH
jgi:hypothetical protein